MTLSGTLRQQCRERLLFQSGEFHVPDGDILSWTLEEREIMLEERDQLIKEWKKQMPKGKKPKKGGYGRHRGRGK